ncbi:LysR substrate-binding domain-containing protein [Pelagibius sp. CAU 1746]|uniref:LysR substrate-binding domain-containing protein n=1 Tax=Pelagibius sp. CAU 1746 TaxID=3140370 RepID=UPI00325A7864
MARRYLPPFAALRAFEAVARSLSFTRAADELGITQAAVSRQVRLLECELGVRLVERRPRGNELTAPGRSLSAALRDSLDAMAAAVREVSSHPARTVLTVSVAPYFSACWLTPRIMGFVEAHPQIDLRLHHSYEPPDYRRDQIDLGINWGAGEWPGVAAERVLDGSMTPLCSPAFLDRCGGLRRPADLLGRQLFFEFRLSDWAAWFAAAGVSDTGELQATRLDDSNALRRAALDGHGVALFFRSLAQDDLAIGRLVEPFGQAADTGSHYFLNYPAGRELSSGGKAFRRWLRAELRRDAD